MTKKVITSGDMQANDEIRNIILLWPSRRVLAEDMGVDVVVVHRWWQRRSIPAGFDAKLIDAARRRELPLSFERLALARADAA